MSPPKTDGDLVGAFLDRAPKGASHGEALAQMLAEIASAAEKRWAPVAVPRDVFATYLGDRISASHDRGTSTSLQDLHGSDLYLACACARGIEPALAAFEAEIAPAARRALVGLDRSGALADDAMQRLRQRLFVGKAGRPPRIVDYLGHGDLRRWVRAAALRIGLDLLRAAKRDRAHHEDEQVLAALPDAGPDPELALLRARYGEKLKAAFGEALRSRPARERSVLRYHHIDGLNIDQIGAVFQVHRTTAYRWLERARQQVVAETRKLMQHRLGVKRSELESIMRLIHSQLDLSIRRALEPPEPES